MVIQRSLEEKASEHCWITRVALRELSGKCARCASTFSGYESNFLISFIRIQDLSYSLLIVLVEIFSKM